MNTTKSRLASYRAQAAQSLAKNGITHYSNWRAWRSNPWQTASNSRGPKGQIYSENLSQYGDVCLDDKDNRKDRNACGWYTDNFQSACQYGAVVKLRCPKGALYIPCTYNDDWDGTTHYINDAELAPKGATEDQHHEAMQEAIRSARHYAEHEAEASREEDAKFQAERQQEDARQDIQDCRTKAHAIIAELRTITLPPALCTMARNNLASLRAEVRQAIKTIRKLDNNYWEAVQ